VEVKIFYQWAMLGIGFFFVLYFFSSKFTWLFEVLSKKKASFQLVLLGLISVYTAVSWAFSQIFQRPLYQLFPWMALVTFASLALLVAKILPNGGGLPRPNQDKTNFRPVVEICIFFLIIAFLFSLFIVDVNLPVLWSGNNDIWAYSKFSNALLNQPVGNNIVGYNLMDNPAVRQTPTAFMFLSGLAYFSGQEVVNVLGIALIIILTVSAYFVKAICTEILKVRSVFSFLIAGIWVTSAFQFYISGNYFLAQWIGIAIFLASILTVLRDENSSTIQIVKVSLLFYLLFMSYPGLFMPYIGILIFIKFVQSMFLKVSQHVALRKSGLLTVIFALPVSLVIAFMFNPPYFLATMGSVLTYNNSSAGWGLHLVNPVPLISIPLFRGSLDNFLIPSDTILKMDGYLFIAAFIGFINYRRYRLKILSSEQFAVSFAFVTCIIVYLLYYHFKPDSYQQWKFAASIVMPLAFLPVAFLINLAADKKNVVVFFKYLLLLLIVGANVYGLYHVSNSSRPFAGRYSSLKSLASLDQDPAINTISIKLKNDFNGTMIAANFVNKKPVKLLSASYFSDDKEINIADIPEGDVLVTNTRPLLYTSIVQSIGDSFYILKGGVRGDSGYTINFNAAESTSLVTAGLSGVESWGRWSDGSAVTIEIPIFAKWESAQIEFKGNPFLPAGIVKQRLVFSIHGAIVKNVEVSSETILSLKVNNEQFDKDHITLRIDLPDAVSPSKFGFSDRRVLAFAFQYLKVDGTIL
jgi:hypothetical protein